nr:DNA repair protein [Bacilli bacterium]
MSEDRTYFVIDAKSFYASVECAERGLDPMTTNLVVADAERTDKTICLAVSPAMKKLGVKNRCRLFEIPKGIEFIIAKPRMKKYINYAAEIYGIYLKYISKSDIHVYSIDECIIDVTSYLKLYKIEAKDFAKKLMNEIYETFHIPCTCGIGTNMYLAKIALGITAKHSPDRIGYLNQELFRKTLSHHRPLTDFWGISRGITARLERMGIVDMDGITKANEDLLYDEFGVNAELLIDHANGIETCTMENIKNYQGKSKSLSNAQVFGSNYAYQDALLVYKEMVEHLSLELAKQHLVTNLIVIYIGYDGLGNINGSRRLDVITNLSKYLMPDAIALFEEVCDKNKGIRRIGISFGDLYPESSESYNLLIDLE